MAQVVNADVVDAGAFADQRPGLSKIHERLSRKSSLDDVWVIRSFRRRLSQTQQFNCLLAQK
jgi:hypothetical protein